MLSAERAAMKQRVGVLIDLGNSETRVRIKYRPLKGLEGIHEPVDTTFSMSNHYAGLVTSYVISPDYMNENTTIFDIDGVRMAHGDLVEREFVGAYDFPSGKSDKSSEPITRWTLNLIMIKVIHLLAAKWGIAPSEVDVAFDVYCLVPPDEHAYNKKAMTDLIKDIDEVIELVPNGDEETYRRCEYPILCNSIFIAPEGITAFFGARVNIDGYKVTPNPDVEKYMKGYCLIIDIGAGTTDLAIMQDGMLKADSRQSIPDAGNHIISALQRNIKSIPSLRGRLHMGIKNVESVMKYARISEADGLIEADCIPQLNDAKEEVARELANTIRNYANGNSVMSMVKGIFVVGGANTAAVRDNTVVSPALAEFLVPKIMVFADLAELVEIKGRDPRYLNLDGLEAMYLTALAKK